MRKLSNVGSYCVIASGSSTTQVKAIADHIAKKLKDDGQKLWHIEGAREALWILLDFGDVIAHIFLEETRHFYDLERLWENAPQEKFDDGTPKKIVKSKTKKRVRKMKKISKLKTKKTRSKHSRPKKRIR